MYYIGEVEMRHQMDLLQLYISYVVLILNDQRWIMRKRGFNYPQTVKYTARVTDPVNICNR